MSRMDRVNQQIKQEVGVIIQQHMRDPRLEFVSITYVDVSPDLRNARVLFSVLGNQDKGQVVVDVLNKASGHIRHLLAKTIKIRHIPELHFEYDETLLNSIKIEKTIEELKHDDQERGGSDS